MFQKAVYCQIVVFLTSWAKLSQTAQHLGRKLLHKLPVSGQTPDKLCSVAVISHSLLSELHTCTLKSCTFQLSGKYLSKLSWRRNLYMRNHSHSCLRLLSSARLPPHERKPEGILHQIVCKTVMLTDKSYRNKDEIYEMYYLVIYYGVWKTST